jgi:AraC-like DNA-binding protein
MLSTPPPAANPSSAILIQQQPSQIQTDHGGRALGMRESAHIWRNPSLRGVELFQGRYTDYEFTRHFHAVPAIGVVDRGCMRTYCKRANHFVPQGTVLLLNPGDVHAPGPADEQGWSFRIFFFDDAFFHATSKQSGRQLIPFSQPFVRDRLLARSLLYLHRLLETHAITLQAESVLHDVFEYLTHRYSTQLRHQQPSAADGLRMQRVREYLSASYMHDVTLTDLAAVADLSTSHLLRSFRKHTGITPHAYLIQMRIEASKSLLRLGNAISDVADATGFTDQSHFTRHFKRIMGVTPGQYLPRDVSV